MRICMITSVPLPPTEGVGHYVWNLSRFLIEQGHHVQIITRSQRGKPFREEIDGLPVWRPRFYPLYPFHVHLHGVFVQRLVRRIEDNVDVFHIHTPLAPPIRSHSPSLLTVHSMMIPDTKERRVDSAFEVLIRLQSPVSALIEKRLLATSQVVTTVSSVAAENVRNVCPELGSLIEITWNGTDTEVFTPDRDRSKTRNRFLYVGRVAPGKGLEDLVSAMSLVVARHPAAKLSIVGDGPLKSRIQAIVVEAGLDRHVKFLGHVGSRTVLCDLYRDAAALVLSSHHESLPTVVLEAMACGTPAIATSVGSVPDVVCDEENGLLVSPHAPREMADAMCRILDQAHLVELFGMAARRTIEERFSWQVVGRSYLRQYQAMMREAA